MNGATGAPTGTVITVDFSEPVTNVTASTFLLTVDGAPVPGTVTTDNGWMAVFTPSSALDGGKTYTAKVTTGVTDNNGISLANDFIWSFTVADAPDTTPPAIISTYPGEGATGAPFDNTTIKVTFSEPVRNVTEETFILRADGVAVPGRVTLVGPTASFTATTPLSAGPVYRATVTTGVTDLSGNSLSADYSWSFTRGQYPGVMTNLESGSDDAYSPQVAMSEMGITFAVWVQSDGTADSIWANRNLARIGWGVAPTLIETGEGRASSPRVAADNSGNAIAVWVQSDGMTDSIWSNRYEFSTGWGMPIPIDNRSGQASSPQVSMDRSGNAIVVWVQSDGTADSIWSNRYVPETGWGTATLIEPGPGNASSPRVVTDNNGSALAVWVRSDGTADRIWSNRYVPETGWGTTAVVEAGAGNASSPDLTLSGVDNAIAVWVQSDGTADSIWSNRYVPATGWGTPTLIEAGSGNAFSPRVAADNYGNAIAVWVQFDGETDSIWSCRYAPATGWGTPTPIEARSGRASSPQVAMSQNNKAAVVWEEWNGTHSDIVGYHDYIPSPGGCAIAGTGGGWKEGIGAYGPLLLALAARAVRRRHRRLPGSCDRA